MRTPRERIAITTLFDNTALRRHHLGPQRQGRVTVASWALLALGLLGLGVALYGFFTGRAGLGSIAAMAASGTLVFAIGRAREERRAPHFVIGEDVDADLPVAAVDQPGALFALLRAEDDHYALRFTPSMSGWISDAGGFAPLAQLIAVGRARPEDATGTVYRLALPVGCRAQVEIGNHALSIESVDEDDPLKGGAFAHFSWSSQLFTGVSFLAHAIILALVLAVPDDGVTMTLDTFNKNNRFVNYLVKPPVEEEPNLLDKLPKPKAQARAGGRHRGPEGKAGDPKAPKRRRRIAVKGPADNPNPAVAKALAKDAAQRAGLLGLLKQSPAISSIFSRSDTALGRDVEDAWANLIADASPGPAYGVFGLGVVGKARGGGHGLGDGLGLVTIGDIGPGTKPGGTGTGVVGNLRRRTPERVPPVGIGRVITRGALDKSIVRRYVRKHLQQFKFCYQRALQKNAKLQGRVVIRFLIMGTGQVGLSQVKTSTMGHAPTEQCLAKTMRRIVFPKPQGGGTVMVSYPFIFRPAGR